MVQGVDQYGSIVARIVAIPAVVADIVGGPGKPVQVVEFVRGDEELILVPQIGLLGLSDRGYVRVFVIRVGDRIA